MTPITDAAPTRVVLARTGIRRFALVRDYDVSGVSGTGLVAVGVVFPDGQAVMQWQSDLRSTAIYASVETLIAIHGHEGATRLVYVDLDQQP